MRHFHGVHGAALSTGRPAPLALLSLLVAAAAFAQAPPSAQPATASAPATATAAPTAATAAAKPKVDPYATEFIRLCSGCHTIGGGVLTGPDLIAAARWPDADRKIAIKRMEKNVGPLTPAEIDGLSNLLASPDVQAKLQAARQARVEEMAATLEPGVPESGRALFYGQAGLVNGGVGCFSCHAVAGRGGNMAKDLTTAWTRLGEQAVLSTAQQPAFPMMKAAYAGRPVTAQEAAHLAAFLKSAAAAVPAGRAVPAPTDGLVAAHAGAGVLLLAVIAGIALTARARRAGVRARLVRDSFRR